MRLCHLIPLAGLLAVASAGAAPPLSFAQRPVPPGHVPSTAAPAPPLPDIKGVVSWSVLANVKQVKAKDRVLPDFGKEVAALHDKEVRLQGFIMPLETGAQQKHFLLTASPQDCSYCLPAGPEAMVEIRTRTPVKYTFQAIVLSGRMQVMKDDPMGLYYRLTDAVPASVD